MTYVMNSRLMSYVIKELNLLERKVRDEKYGQQITRGKVAATLVAIKMTLKEDSSSHTEEEWRGGRAMKFHYYIPKSTAKSKVSR